MFTSMVRFSRPYMPRHQNGTPKFNVPAAKPVVIVKATPELEDRIIYSEPKFLLFDKPSGAAIQGSYGSTGRRAFDALVMEIQARPDSPEVFVVHRLDKSTTGLMVFAKTKVGAAAFSKQFQSRMVKKCYLAIVAGEIKGSGEIQDKLVVGDMRVSRATSETEDESVEAITKWESLSSNSSYSLLKLTPATGRKHQLRVHCAESLSAGIIGDYKYSPNFSHRALLDFAPDVMLLHSYSIEFYTWEKNGKRRTVAAAVDPPEVFSTFARLAGLDMSTIRSAEVIQNQEQVITPIAIASV